MADQPNNWPCEFKIETVSGGDVGTGSIVNPTLPSSNKYTLSAGRSSAKNTVLAGKVSSRHMAAMAPSPSAGKPRNKSMPASVSRLTIEHLLRDVARLVCVHRLLPACHAS